MSKVLAITQERVATNANARASQVIRSESVKKWCIRLLFLVVVLGSWQLAATIKLVNPMFTGMPTIIARRFASLLMDKHFLADDVLLTVEETVSGYILGVVLGIGVAVAFVKYRAIEAALSPIFAGVNSLPRVALAPIFVTWFGLGLVSRSAVAVTLVFFIMVSNTVAGFTQADRDLQLLARSLGANDRQWFLKFLLPGAIPAIASGLQLGLVFAFLGTVAAELLGGAYGVGAVLSLDASAFKTNSYFAVLVVLGLVSTILSLAIGKVTHAMMGWQDIESGNGKVKGKRGGLGRKLWKGSHMEVPVGEM